MVAERNGQADGLGGRVDVQSWSAAWLGRGTGRLEEFSDNERITAPEHGLPEGTGAGERMWSMIHPPWPDLLAGLVTEASTWRTADLGSIPFFGVNLFLGGVKQVTSEVVIQWLTNQTPGVIRSALGLVYLVSV